MEHRPGSIPGRGSNKQKAATAGPATANLFSDMTKIPEPHNSCMRVLDLFSGIGGFSLAAHWMGWETVAFCERDKFCQQVLRKHWPNVPIYDDIISFDNPPAADLVCGGYPCQPFSQAGKRKGNDDDRALWPAMLAVIAKVRPTWVVAENVAGHISLGLDDVLADLEAEGYATWPLVIPACAVGAPHRRDRVWIVAHAESPKCKFARNSWSRGQGPANIHPMDWKADWLGVAAATCIQRADDGLPRGLDGSKRPKSYRAARLKALGNSIVPQVAYQIFRAIAVQEGGVQ